MTQQSTHAGPARRRIVGVSLKMYFSLAQTRSYMTSLLPLGPLAAAHSIDLFVVPDFLSIIPSATILASTSTTAEPSQQPIWLGAQDSFYEDRGAYTGEVSPADLAEAGVQIVEVGHAERRRIFHETDEETAKKAAAIARHGMVPLVCIGEVSRLSSASDGGVAAAVAEVAVQVDAVLAGIKGEDAQIVLAYEPVWAIGAKEPAAKEHVLGVVEGIRSLTSVKAREGKVRIVYGGSAGPGTFEGLKSQCDGLFLGRFAHDIGNLKRVIEEMAVP